MKVNGNLFYEGRQDGLNNRPKKKGLKPQNNKVYLAGYAEGSKERSRS